MSLAAIYLFVVPVHVPALQCRRTKLVLQTEHPWTPADQSALDAARRRCPKLYLDSPCVRKFIRVEPGTYRVVCGAGSL